MLNLLLLRVLLLNSAPTSPHEIDTPDFVDRAEAMLIVLEGDGPLSKKDKGKHTWKRCAVNAIAKPFGCVGGAIKTACACVPKIVKEFEGYKCPVIG